MIIPVDDVIKLVHTRRELRRNFILGFRLRNGLIYDNQARPLHVELFQIPLGQKSEVLDITFGLCVIQVCTVYFYFSREVCEIIS